VVTRKRPARAAKTAASAADAGVGLRYLESSALVAGLLEQDREALESLRAGHWLVTSALTFAEAARAIVRARATDRLTPDQERAAIGALRRFERRCYVVSVTDAVLARVRRRFPAEPVRTLDALHLATAESLGEPPQLMTVVTRDLRVRANATALGFSVE
jgi:predicted nucleic acid-binding protein